MQWKPHSCILKYEKQVSHKVQSMVLKIFICPSHITNWSLGLLQSMGCNRHPIRALESFHYQEIFAYDQQVSFYLKMSNLKDQISTQFSWKQKDKRWSLYWGMLPSIGNTWVPMLDPRQSKLLYRLRHGSLHHSGQTEQGAWIETKDIGTNCWSLSALSDPCTRRGF